MNLPRPDDDDILITMDPLEIVERVLMAENLSFDRTDDGDIAFSLTGDWKDYEMWFAWRPEAECLQLCLSVDVRVEAALRASAFHLVNLINQRVWLGHFEIWADDGQCVLLNVVKAYPDTAPLCPYPEDVLDVPGVVIRLSDVAANRLI